MKRSFHTTALGNLCIILAGCLWGTTGLFLNQLYAIGLTAMHICVLRSGLTTLLLIIFLLIRCPKLLRVRLRDLWCFLGSGILSILFFNYCYFSAIQESGMAVAATLLYTSPVFVVLLSALLFKEKITLRKVVALVISLVGCALVSGILAGGGKFTAHGLLLGLEAGFGYSLYSIFTRFAIRRLYNSLTITVYTFLFATVGGLFFTDVPAMGQLLMAKGWQILVLLVLYAFVTTVLSYTLYNIGLQHIDNSKASVLSAVEPISATLLGLFFLNQHPTPMEWGGILLVLVALMVLNWPAKKKA